MGVINGLRAILDQSDYYYRETKLSGNGIVTIVGFSNSCELCQQIYIQKYILFFITKMRTMWVALFLEILVWE